MVKVKALKDCIFGYKGEMFRFKVGEVREINVPKEKIDDRSFEFLEDVKKIIKDKRKEIKIEEVD